MTDADAGRTRPLTGIITIDWSDASDANDASATPNFGWRVRAEPPIDDEWMAALLHEIGNAY
jgi:hypothetical protein